MLRFNGFAGGNVKKEVYENLFKSRPSTRKEALTVVVQATRIFDNACRLKGPQKITPIIKKQIREGKWDF